eukprot:12894233-Prorocentrum_lima.AAC.1
MADATEWQQQELEAARLSACFDDDTGPVDEPEIPTEIPIVRADGTAASLRLSRVGTSQCRFQ